jgi:hypothetical protein
MGERTALRIELDSPSREATARYDAKTLASDLGRESRARSGRVSPPTPIAARARRPQRARVRARPRPTALRLRARRIVALTALLLVLDLVVSFWGAVAGPSNVSFGVRAVEWLRDNGAAGAVSEVESIYYSLNAPSTGGPPLKQLPKVGSRARVRFGSYAPPPIFPAITPALPGEGQWHGTGPLVAGGPPVLVTTFRSDPNYPQIGRRRRVDRRHADAARAVSGPRRATQRRQPAGGGAPGASLRFAGDVQQWLQARGLGGRLLLPGSCVRADEGRTGDADRVQRRGHRRARMDRRSRSGTGDRVRAPEPAPDRRERLAQPGAVE